MYCQVSIIYFSAFQKKRYTRIQHICQIHKLKKLAKLVPFFRSINFVALFYIRATKNHTQLIFKHCSNNILFFRASAKLEAIYNELSQKLIVLEEERSLLLISFSYLLFFLLLSFFSILLFFYVQHDETFSTVFKNINSYLNEMLSYTEKTFFDVSCIITIRRIINVYSLVLLVTCSLSWKEGERD